MSAKRLRRNKSNSQEVAATSLEKVVATHHKGDGTSNGVNYSYSISTRPLTGRYECRIHKYLFASNVCEFLTKDFELAGRKWRVKITRMENGCYSLYLLMRNAPSAIVHYSFVLVNHDDPQKNQMKAWRTTFKSESPFGYKNLFSGDVVRDRSSGYLLGDSIVVVVRMRQCTVENESLGIAPMQRALICTWSLRHVDDLGPAALKSAGVNQGSAIWNVKLEPYKAIKDNGHCGAYLCCYAERPIEAQCKITLLNHRNIGQRVAYDAFTHKFPIGFSFWGWPNFVEKKALRASESGFVDDEGWITLIAHISLLDAEERSPQQLTERAVERQQSISENEDDALCVVCLEKRQTSGFVHGKTSHKCVCAECCELLHARKSRCPVCNAKVDSIITAYF